MRAFLSVSICMLGWLLIQNIGVALSIPIIGLVLIIPTVVIFAVGIKYYKIIIKIKINWWQAVFGFIFAVGINAITSYHFFDPLEQKLSIVAKGILSLAIPLASFVQVNDRCPTNASDLSEFASKAKLLDPYVDESSELVFLEIPNECLIYSVGPDGINDGGKEISQQGNSNYRKLAAQMKPQFLHLAIYDSFVARKYNGDIVVKTANVKVAGN